MYILKKIARKMAGAKKNASYGNIFREFNILLLAREYFILVLSFAVDNTNKLIRNSDMYKVVQI